MQPNISGAVELARSAMLGLEGAPISVSSRYENAKNLFLIESSMFDAQ